MTSFSKLSVLLNKLYRLYGSQKNKADSSETDRALYAGVYYALQIAVQLVSNSNEQGVLLNLCQREIDKYQKLVAKHPQAEEAMTPAQFEERGKLMGYKLFKSTIDHIDNINVNDRFVLQRPEVQLSLN